jgi:multidrug transporter EmrE-like cation transporter
MNASVSVAEPENEGFHFSHRQSVGLVFLCTLFGVGAQYLIKLSALSMPHLSVMGVLMNWQMWLGLSLYGISTALLVLALRDGELSLLYPVISLTYVWVTLLSVTVFKETMNWQKIVGVTIICAGVAYLGKKER